jgi:hypothetical protein
MVPITERVARPLGIDVFKGRDVYGFKGTIKGNFKGVVLDVNTNFIKYRDIIIYEKFIRPLYSTLFIHVFTFWKHCKTHGIHFDNDSITQSY